MRGPMTAFTHRGFHPISSRPCQAHTKSYMLVSFSVAMKISKRKSFGLVVSFTVAGLQRIAPPPPLTSALN